MAPTTSLNTTNLEQENSDDGGLSPAIWFLITVAIIVLVCHLITIFCRKTRFCARHVDANQERQTEPAPNSSIAPAQPAHIQHRVKTGKIRLQALDRIAPSVHYKVWKVQPRSEDTAVNDQVPIHDVACLAIETSHPFVSTLSPNLGPTRMSAKGRSSTASSNTNTEAVTLVYADNTGFDGHTKSEGYESVVSCVICHDSLVDDARVRKLQCRHVFHADCIEKWLTTCRGSCPICNARVELCAVPG